MTQKERFLHATHYESIVHGNVYSIDLALFPGWLSASLCDCAHSTECESQPQRLIP